MHLRRRTSLGTHVQQRIDGAGVRDHQNIAAATSHESLIDLELLNHDFDLILVREGWELIWGKLKLHFLACDVKPGLLRTELAADASFLEARKEHRRSGGFAGGRTSDEIDEHPTMIPRLEVKSNLLV